MVVDVSAGISWVFDHIGDYGGDRTRCRNRNRNRNRNRKVRHGGSAVGQEDEI